MDLRKPFALERPCVNCPFRKVGAIELRAGRVEEIIEGIVTDDMSPFLCHKTTHMETSSYCVGAMVYLQKVNMPNVAMRLGNALGMFDPCDLYPYYGEVIDPPLRD